MIKGLITGLIASLFGIIAGLFYFEYNERNLEQKILVQLRSEIADLKKTNELLIRDLIRVQAITSSYDTDAKFIESVEAYNGLAGNIQ